MQNTDETTCPACGAQLVLRLGALECPACGKPQVDPAATPSEALPPPDRPQVVPYKYVRLLESEFDPSHSLFKPLLVMLGIVAILLLYMIICELGGAGTTIFADETTTDQPLTRLEATYIFAYLVFLLAGAAGFVVFLIWLYRSNANLPRLGSFGLRFDPAFAVAAWFIPVVYLLWPYQAMQEVYRASDPDTDLADPIGWRKARPGYLLVAWWVTVLIAHLMWLIWGSLNKGSLRDSGAAALISILTYTVELVVLILAAIVVRTIQDRQEQRYAALERRAKSDGQPVREFVHALAATFGANPELQRAEQATAARRADHLRIEKFAFIGSIILYAICLIIFFSLTFNRYNNDTTMHIFATCVVGLLYLVGALRTFFGELHWEKWTCFGLVVVFGGILAVILIASKSYTDPVSLAWYGSLIVLQIWLISILIRDAARWRATARNS